MVLQSIAKNSQSPEDLGKEKLVNDIRPRKQLTTTFLFQIPGLSVEGFLSKLTLAKGFLLQVSPAIALIS